uniref:type IV pilus biogenesis protein PilI n=1 Tax=Micrococcus sp. HSID17228 TaxID=2419507 RepID=UPI00352A0575
MPNSMSPRKKMSTASSMRIVEVNRARTERRRRRVPGRHCRWARVSRAGRQDSSPKRPCSVAPPVSGWSGVIGPPP